MCSPGTLWTTGAIIFISFVLLNGWRRDLGQRDRLAPTSLHGSSIISRN